MHKIHNKSGPVTGIGGPVIVVTWWRHQMEILSALLALCEGNPFVTGGFPSQWASDAELWCFLWSTPEKRAHNPEAGDSRRHHAHYDVTAMNSHISAVHWDMLPYPLKTKNLYFNKHDRLYWSHLCLDNTFNVTFYVVLLFPWWQGHLSNGEKFLRVDILVEVYLRTLSNNDKLSQH